MTKMTDKPAIPRKTGMTHGVRAFVDSGKLPSGRLYRRAMKDVSLIRERLIVKYGGDKIEPDVLAMVDTAAKAMMVQELCTIYIKRAGILRKDSLDAGNLELHSVLAKSYASYANLVRLSLEAAGRLADRKQQTSSQAELETYLTSFSRVDEPEKTLKFEFGSPIPVEGRERAPDGPGSGPSVPQGAQNGQTAGGQAEPRTDSGVGPDGDIQDKEKDDDRDKV